MLRKLREYLFIALLPLGIIAVSMAVHLTFRILYIHWVVLLLTGVAMLVGYAAEGQRG